MSDVNREEFLSVTDDDSNDQLLAFIAKHHSKDDPFSLDELLPMLSKRQLTSLWQNLQRKCTSTLLHFDDEEPGDLDPVDRCAVLQAVVTVAQSTLAAYENENIPQELFETLVLLHGVLLSLPAEMDQLRHGISHLCETWWSRELIGREHLVPQMLGFLFSCCIVPGATNVNMKRLWRVRETVFAINFADPRSDSMKALFQDAAKSPSFIRSPEGRKFLAFLFTVNVDLIPDLHLAMKSVIATASKTSLDWIGEVYFRGWQESDGQVRETIELSCIQDLMFHGVHAKRDGGNNSPAAKIYRILHYFHKQKKQAGAVDHMLLKLYDPILWRSLKVANYSVRANAADLLIDAFPLRDDTLNAGETDALLQKQFDALKQLLEDPVPAVRSIVASGVCRVCAIYWEFIPADAIRSLLTPLVQMLAFDASSADVRVAVVKGLTFMVDYRLSHPLLQSVLPKLCNLFHDKIEKVRLAMVNLLLKVKSQHVMKFWTVVPIDHLLARLECDSSAIAKRIVELLIDSYMPQDKPLDSQLTRAVRLIRSNPLAARKFYLYSFNHIRTVSAVKFIVATFLYLTEVVASSGGQIGSVSNCDDSVSRTENEASDETTIDDDLLQMTNKNLTASGELTNTSVAADDNVNINDVNTIAGLLDSVVILWMSIRPELNNPTRADVRRRLEQHAAKLLPILLRNFQDARILSPLTTVAGFLPANAVPMISCGILSKLKALATVSSSTDDFESLLSTMCQWKKGTDVLDLISDWIEPCLGTGTASSRDSSVRRSGRTTRTVMFAETVESHPEQALRYLEFVMTNAPCQMSLLEHNRPKLRALANSLKNVTSRIESRLRSGIPLDEPLTDELLVKMFVRYLLLEVLLSDKNATHNSAIDALEHQLAWIDSQLAPCLGSSRAPLSTGTRRKRTRKLLTASNSTLLMTDPDSEALTQTMLSSDTSVISNGISVSTDTKNFVSSLIKRTLLVLSDVLLVGLVDSELVSRLGEFCLSLLQLDVSFLADILPLMFRMTELLDLEKLASDNGAAAGGRMDVDEDEGVGCRANPLPQLLTKSINVLSELAQTGNSRTETLLPELRHPLGDVLEAYFIGADSRSISTADVISAAVSAVTTDMLHAVQEDCHFEAQVNIQQLPTFTAFLLGLLVKKPTTARLFMSDLELLCQSSVAENVEGFGSCVHIVNSLISEKLCPKVSIKRCIAELQQRESALSVADDVPDDAPTRILLKSAHELLLTCCQRVGIVIA